MTMPADPFVFQLPSRTRESRAEDLRLTWRDACSDARLAYVDWRDARRADAREAFAAYVAAADREAAAAETFRRGGLATPAPVPAASRRCGSSPPS
jgi:hypothetical protein